MLNEYLAFPHQSPVLVQIASVTRATHFDLALTIKKVFPQNAPRINRTWIHATVSLGSVGYLILHTKDSRDATSLRQTRKILLKNSSIHFFFFKGFIRTSAKLFAWCIMPVTWRAGHEEAWNMKFLNLTQPPWCNFPHADPGGALLRLLTSSSS